MSLLEHLSCLPRSIFYPFCAFCHPYATFRLNSRVSMLYMQFVLPATCISYATYLKETHVFTWICVLSSFLGFLGDLRAICRVFKGPLHVHDSWEVFLSLLGALFLYCKSLSSIWTCFHFLPPHLLLLLDLAGQGTEQPLFVGLDWYLGLLDICLCQSFLLSLFIPKLLACFPLWAFFVREVDI